MEKTNKRLAQIFDRYVNKIASEEEKIELWDYINDPLFTVEVNELLEKDYTREHNDLGLNEHQKSDILQNVFAQGNLKKTRTIQFWPKIAIAASILIIVSLGGYFYINKQPDKLHAEIAYANDIAPGKNGATLTLANGQKILIKDALNGNIASQSGVKISKTADGQIFYTITQSETDGAEQEIQYNTLSTTRGEQAQVRLPDGTVVFLNAESSLKYPTRFAKSDKRLVSLSGEGYFEVAKDKAHPFVVQSAHQKVQVIGTHFNIMAYKEDKTIKTTLLEGAVKVNTRSNSKTLVPGQQASVDPDHISVIDHVDLEDVVAWKNGYFKFNENLEGIMNKIARWYNVEIVYEMKPAQDVVFGGEISRSKNLSTILKIMELEGNVHFRIEGRRVFVMR